MKKKHIYIYIYLAGTKENTILLVLLCKEISLPTELSIPPASEFRGGNLRVTEDGRGKGDGQKSIYSEQNIFLSPERFKPILLVKLVVFIMSVGA